MRRHDKRLIPLLVGVFVATFSFAFLMNHSKTDFADAANLANFKPGNIISNYTMSNYNSMTLEEIQSFLTSKNACSNRDYNYYLTLTRTYPDISWHWEDNHFVCLSEERFGDGTVIGEGKTAAQIIYETAQEYKINPQVLIVLIEKESSLITDPIPNNRDYRTMTGFGCPDTAPCDSQYFGFKNQVRKAAWLFREVLDGGWTNYPLGENYIQYNPNASCGGSIVNIENLATSALYRYTPYQPNAGAIAAGTGTAYCGAYGNRNFYIYFEDWFGGIKDEHEAVDKLKKAEIENGTYYVESVLGKDIRMDVSESNVLIKQANEQEDFQQWVFEYNDGYYVIKNKKTGKVLDVAGAGTKNGTNIRLYDFNDTCAQKWDIRKDEDENLVFISKCSKSVADVKGASMEDGTNIRLYEYNETNAQKWTLIRVYEPIISEGEYEIVSALSEDKNLGNHGSNVSLRQYDFEKKYVWELVFDAKTGYYKIIDSISKKVIGAESEEQKNGTNVQLYEDSTTCAQQWEILEDKNYYVIKTACSTKVLDVAGAATNDDTNIRLYDMNNTKAQQWKIKKNSSSDEKQVVIYWAGDNNGKKVMDVAAAGTKNGSNVQIYDHNGTCAQKWVLKKEGEYYSIRSACSDKVLDVAAASKNNGANIQLYNYNGTCAQLWKIQQEENYYKIISSCSAKVVDVAGNFNKNATNINQYSQNGTMAQKWIIKRIE